MKKSLFILSFFALSSFSAYSQSGVEYTYDATGNRTARQVITLAPSSAKSITHESYVIDTKPQLIVSPNPTYGEMTIQTDSLSNEGSNEILIYSMQGSILFRKKMESSSEIVNITNQPAGVYLMVIKIGKSRNECKIIKK